MATKINVGIDYGTTNTVVYANSKGTTQEIHIQHGQHVQRSVPVIDQLQQWSLWSNGQPPDTTELHRSKRLLGRPLADGQLQADANRILHTKMCERGARYRIGDIPVEVEEVAGFILGSVREAVKNLTEEPIGLTVIAIPIAFTTCQREATLDAAYIGGLTDVRTIPEPVAATLAFAYSQPGDDKFQHVRGTSIVVDIGGGTTDVSAVFVDRSSDDPKFVVQATVGDNRLGGVDFDEKLYPVMLTAFGLEKSQELHNQAEHCKKALSTREKHKISIAGANGRKKTCAILRAHFEDACADLIGRIRRLLMQLLDDQPVLEKADRLLLVGGQSNMPAVRRVCREVFPAVACIQLQAATVVAEGAMILAAHPEITILDVQPKTIGFDVWHIVKRRNRKRHSREVRTTAVIRRNTQLPAQGEFTFFTREDNQEVLEFQLQEGEDSDPQLNTPLHCYNVPIPPCRSGTPVHGQIEVTRNRTINVSVKLGVQMEGGTTEWTKEAWAVEHEPRLDPGYRDRLRRNTDHRLLGESISDSDDAESSPQVPSTAVTGAPDQADAAPSDGSPSELSSSAPVHASSRIREGTKAKSTKRKAGERTTTRQDTTPVKRPRIKLRTHKDVIDMEKDTPEKHKKNDSKDGKATTPDTEEAALDKKRRVALFLRHKLQRGLLSQRPQKSDMRQMNELLTIVEQQKDEATILKGAKVHKVLSAVLRLDSLPDDDQYEFKQRSQTLLDHWSSSLGN